jgi:transposase-like protein
VLIDQGLRNAARPSDRAQASQTEVLRRLKAELKRVTEKRDILKEAAAYLC